MVTVGVNNWRNLIAVHSFVASVLMKAVQETMFYSAHLTLLSADHYYYQLLYSGSIVFYYCLS